MKDHGAHDLPKSPISFPVNVSRLPQRGMPVKIVADERQRAELAEIHGLESVADFIADLHVAPWKRNGVRVAGTVRATVEQLSASTGEPLRNNVDEDIDTIFLPEKSKLGREGFGQGGEIVLDFDGEDSPETFSGDWIDVGALAEEFFGLGIDPYAHEEGILAEGGELVDHAEPESEAEEESQFARKLRAAMDKAGGKAEKPK